VAAKKPKTCDGTKGQHFEQLLIEMLLFHADRSYFFGVSRFLIGLVVRCISNLNESIHGISLPYKKCKCKFHQIV